MKSSYALYCIGISERGEAAMKENGIVIDFQMKEHCKPR